MRAPLEKGMSRRTRIRNIIAGLVLVALATPILLAGIDLIWKYINGHYSFH